MKLQLDNKTLNAYINEALKQELNENNMDELFGSRVRKQSRRMITGQGWGNQRRNQDNLWGTANTDISSTDADEEVPQTLVGMIRKMENGLCAMEELSGIEPQEAPGALANGVAQYRSGGGFKMKDSLLAAINALSRIADRVSAVEKVSGSNAIMESAGDYMDAAVGGNAAIGNARNMSRLGGLQKTARSASAKQGAATRAINRAAKNPVKYAGQGPTISKNYQTALKANDDAKKALNASNIGRNTGFWGKQVANMKNGAQTVKGGIQTIKGAKNTGNAVQAGVQAYHAATEAGKTAAQASKAAKSAIRGTKTTSQVLKGAGQVAKGIGQIAQIPMLLLTIADEAARQGAQARQRKIVRTYNCAAILAKRMANIAQEIADASGESTAEEPLMETNVRKARRSFDSIEQGMNQLSTLMKQINASVKAARSGSGMPESLDTQQEIKQFQEWANDNGYADQNGQPLELDGKFGPKTNYVYDQIASRIGTVSESREGRKTINESQNVLSALTDLENKVGATGSAGRAYADISRMSGGANGSRMQGAKAVQSIINTYPQVLNQYLQVLSLAGANVRGIQPLTVSKRRNMAILEIDHRIQQLLSIAQSVKDIKPSSKNVKLPPKPVHKPVSSPSKSNGSVENTGTTITRETTPLDISSSNNLVGKAETDSGNELAGERPGLTYPQSAIRTMAQTAQSTMPLKDRRALNNRTTQNTINGLNTMRDNGASRSQIRNDKRSVRDARRTIDRGQTVSEQQFKDMIKEILKEALNK